jgi:triacylglycerol lipase
MRRDWLAICARRDRCTNSQLQQNRLMTHTASRRCPIPGWAFILGFLIIELVAWVWLTRAMVTRGTLTDLQGGLLLLALPFVARFVIALTSYALSRVKGMSLRPEQRMSFVGWWKYFLREYAYLCSQSLVYLPFRIFFHTNTERGLGPATGEVIVLQHGYAHNGAVWFGTARALEKLGYRVYALDQPMFAPIDVMADRLAARIEDIVKATGESQITLIAHSMGGLIARAYLRGHGGARVKKLITIGSPHNGTHHAYLAGGTNGRQMRPGNSWLASLAKMRVSVPFTSIYSVHDTIISPQDSSRMSEATNIELTNIGHVSMPSGAATRAYVIAALTAQ